MNFDGKNNKLQQNTKLLKSNLRVLRLKVMKLKCC